MAARRGATLVEVLVAIFVMGIGLMSLLVLFPLGAAHMAEAVRDDRAAQCGANGAAMARIDKIRESTNTAQPGYGGNTGDPTPPAGMPSYPVYVDPVGYALYGGTPPNVVGVTKIPRLSPPFTVPPSQCTLWDDWTFGTNGLPTGSGANLEREGRYTWAFMTKQLTYTSPQSTPAAAANLWVIVYFQRRQLADFPSSNEKTYPANFGPQSFTVTLSPSSSTTVWPPPVKKGTWLLDGSDPAWLHGDFYRVEEVGTDNGNSIDVYVQTKPRSAASPSAGGRMVVLEDVIEVFQRSTDY